MRLHFHFHCRCGWYAEYISPRRASGIVNTIVTALGGEAHNFMGDGGWFGRICTLFGRLAESGMVQYHLCGGAFCCQPGIVG